jgi:hypothetical protein
MFNSCFVGVFFKDLNNKNHNLNLYFGCVLTNKNKMYKQINFHELVFGYKEFYKLESHGKGRSYIIHLFKESLSKSILSKCGYWMVKKCVSEVV